MCPIWLSLRQTSVWNDKSRSDTVHWRHFYSRRSTQMTQGRFEPSPEWYGRYLKINSVHSNLCFYCFILLLHRQGADVSVRTDNHYGINQTPGVKRNTFNLYNWVFRKIQRLFQYFIYSRYVSNDQICCCPFHGLKGSGQEGRTEQSSEEDNLSIIIYFYLRQFQLEVIYSLSLKRFKVAFV